MIILIILFLLGGGDINLHTTAAKAILGLVQQAVNTSRWPPLVHVYQVWSTSINTFVSYLGDTQTQMDNHNTCLARGTLVVKC